MPFTAATTAQAVVGYVTPGGAIRWVNLNDPAFNPGTPGTEAIANSHSIDRGIGIKSGQVSFGSGSSPTVFKMNNRRFVTIADGETVWLGTVYGLMRARIR